MSPTTPGGQKLGPSLVALTTPHELHFSDSLQEYDPRKTQESRWEHVEVAMQTGHTARTSTRFVGVDIAATTAAVATPRPGAKASQAFLIDQAPEGSTSLRHMLQSTGHTPCQVLVVMEATGA